MRYSTIKLAMGMFILSEAVFFAFLIFAYAYYRPAISSGPNAKSSLDPPVTLIYTVCLLASSGTLWFAERKMRARSMQGLRLWLGATVLLGAAFLYGQGSEYARLIEGNVVPERNLFGATFFTLTGFHGLHVLSGLIALCIMLGIALTKEFGAKDIEGIGAVSWYWHFVDAVWIVIFSLVYLTVWL